MMKKNSYSREEKLKHKKDISLLFEKGKWKSCGNIRIIHLENAECERSKIGVSVSKRYFKKATDRNRIKRLLRESYRLHKDDFAKVFGTQTLAMLFWTCNEKPSSFAIVEREFLNLLSK